VDKDASIASAHLLYQCPAIAAEARAAFTAELQGGLHPVVQLADLPEGKRARYDGEPGDELAGRGGAAAAARTVC
jgi:hypothetical protein